MVQADIAQLSTECTDWRQNLRNYRDEFHQNQKQLQKIAAGASSKDRLQEIEHFENQFHIQLINIHDLKQEIKAHERQVHAESAQDATDDTLSNHEDLFSRYSDLENTLQELRTSFKEFTA